LKKDLQDRAVSNEREYFEDRIAKGKIDLTAVINWMEPYIEENSTQPFTAFSKGTPQPTFSNNSVCGPSITLVINAIPSNIPI
jgi:hypothetical protein